jgi:gliding motility-associated-like protein
MAKRKYINKKYNIYSEPVVPVTTTYNNYQNKSIPYPNMNAKGPGNPIIAVATCSNEDFEQGSLSSPVPGTITIATTAQIPGWTAQGANNNTSSTTDNCTNPYAYGNPNAIQLIAPGANGLFDNVIGGTYRIYSVFGDTTVKWPLAAAQDPFNHYGDWFVKLNNQTPSSSVNRITKTFTVTPSNALFQFAFISVLEGSHGCCDGGGFSLKVKIAAPCSAAPVTTTCPQFTAAVAAGCTSTGNSTTYLNSSGVSGWKYNKWKLNTLDLTSYIGNCVTIEVTAFDCTYTGHAGYVYFDAQCLPMDIIGNGNSFPAGTPSISLPTCGTGNTASITAPPVTGGYTWTPPPPCSSTCYTVAPGSGGQTIYTNITGNFTLTMNPPGSCSPIVRVITVIISPAPNLAITTPTMYSCSNPTLNGAGIQMGSGTPNAATTPNYTVTWSPSPPTGTVGTSANTGTYTGLTVGINTITISDSVGCTATQTLNVTPAPQVPTISISAPSGTLMGCNPSTLALVASNSNTALTNMTYTWQSITTGSATGSTISATAPGGSNTYTVSGYDPTANSCIAMAVITISANTTAPAMTVSPITQALTCNGSCKTFTAVTTTTSNIVGTWFSPPNTPGPVSGTPLLICANAPGTYTAQFCNVINGCCSSETVAVTANTIIPTITVSAVSANGFTINCTNPCVQMVTSSNSTIAPQTYSWTNLTTSVTTMPSNGGFTTCIPGQFVASFKDGNSCTVSNTITVYIDTLRPSPTATTNLPSGSFTLNCNPNSCLVATAVTNPMLPASNYSWTVPPNLTMFTPTVNICLANITSSTSPTSYTVIAMGMNGCIGKQKLNFYKDVYVPPYSIVFTPTAITCSKPCIALTGNNVSGTTTPVSYTFTAPPPTATATTAGALMCSAGTYTMNWTNLLNGCTSQTTNIIALNTTPPGTMVIAPIPLNCGQTTAMLTAGTTTTSTTYSYNWEGPLGAGFTCASCYSTAVSIPTSTNPVEFGVTITNTVNGCVSTNTLTVVPGSITASFYAEPSEGFSPLSVNFINTSTLGSLTGGSLTTTWNYANGTTTTMTLPSASVAPSGPNGYATYLSAGSYTVWMIITQTPTVAGGQCISTASAVVNVELPSEVVVPNVFTPNGDGVNDNFILNTTNLTEISFMVFDRWGVKMYDIPTTDKGNIEWDGKNLSNKDVPAGTYFYIMKAKGKDAKDFEQKGTISLYR